MLSCNNYDVLWYETKTHLLPLTQHSLICSPMQLKKLVTFAELLSLLTAFLYF